MKVKAEVGGRSPCVWGLLSLWSVRAEGSWGRRGTRHGPALLLGGQRAMSVVSVCAAALLPPRAACLLSAVSHLSK